ncbi:MAG: thioredoxin family protein [Cyclobacteriaceae bacterium]|jgi:thioredoxin-related protein|nr:thioredoxin family protein [Cyclobacteriaceae bacterium]
MNYAIIVAACVGLLFQQASAQVARYSSWEKAKAEALASRKQVLILLTGKEWCGPCVKLEREVMATPEFEKLAQDRFVLFEIDIPKSKLLKPESKIVREHAEFSKRYEAPAFPSLILVQPDGTELQKIVDVSIGKDEILRLLARPAGPAATD